MAQSDIAWPSITTSQTFKSKLREAKVLAVGAGGIGCELLKTLVLSGFGNIEVIDMDTIETSNLNRQFLFRKRHVGESKALIAANAVQRFRPAASIKAHRANIKESQYGIDFFKNFAIVLNGLDNLEARRHVNRLCLASGTPLVESGTAGYLGQVSVHMRSREADGNAGVTSECFECQPKAAPKSFPICTIRNTPDKPIHCVVWAKDLLFQRLFGSPEIVTDLDERPSQQDGSAEAAEAEDLTTFARGEGEIPDAYARRIFERVFCTDIEKVLTIEDLWKARKKPTPLRLSDILGTSADSAERMGNGAAAAAATQTPSSALGLTDHHRAWNLRENTLVFLKSVGLFLETRADEVGSAAFDKDDDLAVEVVTAASNLRALCYDIPTQSLFNAKGMAGNIIHAIASTNATIAGMIVVEAMKILAGLPQACKMSYLQQLPSGKRLITAMALSPPNTACVVCGTAQLQLTIHTGTTTLFAFVEKILKRRLATTEPTVMCGGFAYEEGADLEADEVAANQRLLPLALRDLPGGGIGHGAIVSVSDQAQDFSCQIVVSHKEDWDEEKDPDGFTLSGSVRVKDEKTANGDVAGPSAAAAAAEDSDDDFEVLDEPSQAAAAKRKREDGDLGLQPSKRSAPERGPIVLD